MNTKKSAPKRCHPIGIIAEDNSDVDSARILIKRILNETEVGVKKFVGKGCGKIKRKCNAWAKDLKMRGCQKLIVLHDSDSNNVAEIKQAVEDSLQPSPIKKFLICIPVQELEAWLLTDPEAIMRAMKLSKLPKIQKDTEAIASPKEYLGKIVSKCSNGERVYLNTVHNQAIATEISIDCAKRCNSFKEFRDFILN